MLYVLGHGWTDKEVKEILENDIYKNSLTRWIIEFHFAKKEFNESFKETFIYKGIIKILDWLERKLR